MKYLATPSSKIIYQKLPYILLGFNILPVKCFSIKHYTYLRSFGQLDLITITTVCWSSLYSLLLGEKAVRRDILLTAKGTTHFVLHVVIPWVTQLHVLLKIPQLSVSIFFLFTVSLLNSGLSSRTVLDCVIVVNMRKEYNATTQSWEKT